MAVTLHIYDVGDAELVTAVNKVLKPLGTGAFHGAVEVYGSEWSFGYCEVGTGVFSCPPQGCDMHAYRESIPMGQTKLSEKEVSKLLENLSEAWPGHLYDLLRRNCCTFSDELCVQLGVGHIPKWVCNLAGAGATLHDGITSAASKAEATRIIAAAKANEIDEKYQLQAKTAAAVNTVSAKALELDARYGVSTKAIELDAKYGVSSKAKAAAVQTHATVLDAAVQTQAKMAELDNKHDISGKAQLAVDQAATAAGHAATQVGAFFEKLAAGSTNDVRRR